MLNEVWSWQHFNLVCQQAPARIAIINKTVSRQSKTIAKSISIINPLKTKYRSLWMVIHTPFCPVDTVHYTVLHQHNI